MSLGSRAGGQGLGKPLPLCKEAYGSLGALPADHVPLASSPSGGEGPYPPGEGKEGCVVPGPEAR